MTRKRLEPRPEVIAKTRGTLVTHEQHQNGRHTFVIEVGGRYFVLHSTRRVKRITCDPTIYTIKLEGSVPVLVDHRLINYPVPLTDPVTARGIEEARAAAIALLPHLANLFDGSNC